MISPATYWRTIRHLRGKQVLARLWRIVPQLSGAVGPPLPLRAPRASFGDFIQRSGPIRKGDCFQFLNRANKVEKSADWNNHEQSTLWLYNLHYFEWLREVAGAERIAEDSAWLDRWIADNRAGSGVGWDPYPISLRTVNWIIWFMAFGRGTQSHFNSLAAQIRHLMRSIEYQLGGNHLLANATALVFAGTFFEGPEADRWRARGLELLDNQLSEQILADGSHFELSPMYHSLVLEGILDLLGLGHVYSDILDAPLAEMGLKEKASRMAQWLVAVRHPDGQIPYFNDAAFGIAPEPADLLSYAERRGIPTSCSVNHLTVLEPSGFAILSRSPFQVIFDCGRIGPDYLPAHAHADTLSFELSLGGSRLISNSGTSTYERGGERERERSTAAHATVEIDGVSSAETWASFRVGRRPNVGRVQFGTDQRSDWVETSHDGFRYLPGFPIHRRRIMATTDLVCATDWIEGSGVHSIRGILPVHPGVTVKKLAEKKFRLGPPSGQPVELVIDGPVEVALTTGTFAPAFGLTVPRPLIEWRLHGTLPVSVEVRFHIRPPSDADPG
jgi:uncharacterized heparinase superfamily protein